MFQDFVYHNRRNKLLNSVSSGLILMPSNEEAAMNYGANTYHYRQDASFRYFFGHKLPGLTGVIDVDNGAHILFGDDRDIADIIWEGTTSSMLEKGAAIGIQDVRPSKQLQSLIDEALAKGREIKILPPYRGKTILWLSELLHVHPGQLQDFVADDVIKACVKIRSVKELCEVEELDKAMDVAYLMHTTAMKMAQPGTMESTIAGTIEGIALSEGGAVSFPIILSKDGQTLHNHHHHNALKKGDLMLVDAGWENPHGYATDHTRTTPVGGVFTQKQKDIYQIVLDANNNAFAATRPGVAYVDCHMVAARTVAAGLKDLGLMKGDVEEAIAAGAHALFFPHGLGHQLGLDVHDMEGYGENYVGYDEVYKRSEQFGKAYLRYGREVFKGLVLTNEPGIYFIPDLIDMWKKEKKHEAFINYSKVEEYRSFGGIRLEDDLIIEEGGARLLGKKRIPITIEDVEAMVASGR